MTFQLPLTSTALISAEGSVQLTWLPVFADKYYAVETINVPVLLFNGEVEKCRDLFAKRLEKLCKSKVDRDSIEFLMPKRSLSIASVEEVEHDLMGLTTEINPTRSLSTALHGEQEKADHVHLIVVAQKLVVLNWIFLNPEDKQSPIEARKTFMSQKLFQSSSENYHAFFAEEIEKKYKTVIDVETMELWKLKQPLLIADVETLKRGDFIDRPNSFASMVQQAQYLSEALDVEYANQVHAIVFAKENITLNSLLLHPRNQHSVPIVTPISISQSLFHHNRSWQCQDLFVDVFSRVYKTPVDAASIRFFTLDQPLPITDLNNFELTKSSVSLIQPALTLSVALKGKERDDSIVHVLVTIEKEHQDAARPLPEFQRYQQTITTKGKAPSEGARALEYLFSQSKPELTIYDGHRPFGAAWDTVAPPIHIFHRAFNNFLYLIENGPEPSVEDLINTRHLMNFLCELSNQKEKQRNQDIFTHLRKILRQDLIPEKTILERPRPDGTVSISVNGTSIPILIVQLKNELGEGDCDPSIQAGLSMRRCWVVNEVTNIRQRCCCPTFLLIGGGAYVGVLGAVFTDRVIVQRLTGLEWFGASSTEEDRRIRINARILLALRAALKELTQFYRTYVLNAPLLEPDTPHPRYFLKCEESLKKDGTLFINLEVEKESKFVVKIRASK